MGNNEHVKILKKGIYEWNSWRRKNPKLAPDLRAVNFEKEFRTAKNIYGLPQFENANFKNTDFFGVSLRNSGFINCCFDESRINYADLVDVDFKNCTFKNVEMRVTKLGSSNFDHCIFDNTDMSYCSAKDTNFIGSSFYFTYLEHMQLVANNFINTKMDSCFVYGISSWDLILDGSEHKNLIITKEDQPNISVDNIELAQFIYLLINNQKLRNVIDTITSKIVLILGNFSAERKKVLDKLRSTLGKYNLVPVLFDFKKPTSRNLTETIFTLANLSKFVIADISNPRSIGHELSAIIPRLSSVNFYPIIEDNEIEYAMYEEFKNYSWVSPLVKYSKKNILNVLEKIINNEKY